MSKSDNIWFKDFEIIFKKPVDFFPTKYQTISEKLNSIVRLSLYTSIILTIYHSNIKYTSIFIFVLFLTYIIYTNQTNPNDLNLEKLEVNFERPNNEKCTHPTIDNPFMNATMKDYMNLDKNGKIIDREPACDINNITIKKEIDKGFENDLYHDVSDIFGKMNSQRNYYTMPWTTIPNDQEKFANWLYKNPDTCKENQDMCKPAEDLRSNRFIFPNPTENPITTKK